MERLRLKTSIRLTLTERALLRRAGEITGLPWQSYMRSSAIERARLDLEAAAKRQAVPEDDGRLVPFGSLLAGADES